MLPCPLPLMTSWLHHLQPPLLNPHFRKRPPSPSASAVPFMIVYVILTCNYHFLDSVGMIYIGPLSHSVVVTVVPIMILRLHPYHNPFWMPLTIKSCISLSPADHSLNQLSNTNNTMLFLYLPFQMLILSLLLQGHHHHHLPVVDIHHFPSQPKMKLRRVITYRRYTFRLYPTLMWIGLLCIFMTLCMAADVTTDGIRVPTNRRTSA